MRLTTSAVALGVAASAVAQDQKVLNGEPSAEYGAGGVKETWWTPFENMWGEATSEIKDTWNEVSMLVPGAFETFKKAATAKGKKANRRPDSDFDFHVKGTDVEEVFVETDGVKHRKSDGDLGHYGLRAKAVDPSKLKVDDVKQYSGYLDEYDEDKHLFYCE